MSSSYFSTHRWWHSAVSQVCFQVQSCLVIARPPNTCHLYLRLSLHPLLFVSSQFPSLCWNEKYSSNIGEQNWTLASSVWHRKKTTLLSDLDCLLLFFTCTLYEIVSILTLSFAVERDINVFWKYLTHIISNIQSLYHTLTVPCDADLMQRKCDKMKIQVRGTTSWLASPIPGTPLILPSVLVHSSHQGLLATCDAQPFKGWSISISCYVGIRLQLHRVQPFL